MRLALPAAAGILLAGQIAFGHAAIAQAVVGQPLVSTDWLRGHLNDAHVVVLDLRPAAEHDVAHIPGAVAADYEKGGWRVKQADGAGGALPPVPAIAATIAGYGVGDADQAVLVSDDFAAAARIYWTFKVLGHANVSILDGGWAAWHGDAADAVQAGPVTPRQASFTPQYDAALRAELPQVEAELRDGSATLVDARPPGQWKGTEKTGAVAAYGHLPGATWVNQSDAVGADGKLKPLPELEKLFGQVAADKPATAYCNTGHLAATDWFVLSEVLKHPDTSLYDGSLSQYAHDGTRKLVTETP